LGCPNALIEENLEGPKLALGSVAEIVGAASVEAREAVRFVAFVNTNPAHDRGLARFTENVAPTERSTSGSSAPWPMRAVDFVLQPAGLTRSRPSFLTPVKRPATRSIKPAAAGPMRPDAGAGKSTPARGPCSWPRSALSWLASASTPNSLRGPFVFDDFPAIVDNRTIRQLWPLRDVLLPPVEAGSAIGRPLTNLSFALNHALGGLDVRSYHAGNIAIHACAALVLFASRAGHSRSREARRIRRPAACGSRSAPRSSGPCIRCSRSR